MMLLTLILCFILYFASVQQRLSAEMAPKCILLLSLLLYVFTFVSSFSVTSCVDPATPTSLSSAWTSTPKDAKITKFNGSSAFTVEAQDASAGQSFEVKYKGTLRSLPAYRAYLYVEYWNDSPRRLVVQPVKNEKGIDFSLLPGVTSDGAGFVDAVEEIDVSKGMPSITGILKKPQQASFRKLVIFSVRLNSGESVASVVTQLKSKSCIQINQLPESPSPPGSPTGGQQAPLQSTVRPRTPSSSSGNGNACATTTQTSTKSTTTTGTCNTCPECKCVCNCNCKDC